MNKKLIAMAVAAGLASPAMVNAAPTLYGQMQAEIAQIDVDGSASDVALQMDDKKRGRLGVKGDEDLGGGLSAIYMFEWQVDTSDADSNDGNRESWVGLKGGFGQITLGSNKSPYKYYGGVKYDALVATYLQARDSDGANGGGMFSAIGNTSNTFGANGFLQDSVSYKGKFGPTEIWVTYQLAEATDSQSEQDDNIVLGVKVDLGNFEIVAAHAADNDNAAGADGSNTKLGGKAKFGSHSVALQFESHSDDQANRDAESIFIGGVLGFGKNQVILQYGEIDSDANGTTAATADRDYLAVAYKHKFSKTTSAWAGYKTTDGSNGANNLDQDILSLGMRVDF